MSAYLNLLTVYPDQPYDQPEIIHPINGCTIVKPEDMADFQTVLPKEEKVLEIVRAKIAAGERVMIYTSWTRTDTQRKLLGLLREEGIRTEILSTQIVPEKRENWLSKRLSAGTQVIITNPKCVETGLDLNAFTTLISTPWAITFSPYGRRRAGHGGSTRQHRESRSICSTTPTPCRRRR